MPQKKDVTHLLSQEDFNQVHNLLSQYKHIAEDLRASSDQAQAEAALTPITSMTEAGQLALLKDLAREQEQDAADVLTAVNLLSLTKEVRKEARRALIRLEATRIYPRWTPPFTQAPAVQMNVSQPPRFWKGLVTTSREEGEMELLLFWEQGFEYADVRTIAFLLDFWEAGVKDISIDTTTKRRSEERIQDLRARQHNIPLQECTLAEGKRLIEEALSVNQWRKVQPGEDYRAQLPLINRLVLQASDLGTDSGKTFITPELEDQEVVINFLGGWSMGDYGLCYDLLAKDSSLRTNLTRDEWVQQHRAWYDEAHPVRMELGFVHERQAGQSTSTLWVPSSPRLASARKEVEVGWSLELLETPLSGTLTEMPMGTAVNKETGRHWFWTSYTLQREQGAWRIQKISDEGARVQGLPIAELQKRIDELKEEINELIAQSQTNQMSPQTFTEEVSWRLTHMLHYDDALLVQLSLDQSIYTEAYNHAVLTGNPERMMVYLERIAQRFPAGRASTLRQLGSTMAGVAYKYTQPELQARRNALLELSEERLREAMTLEPQNPLTYDLLGELLLSNNRLDEAEETLRRALTLHPPLEQEAALEAGLGNIAMRHEQREEAIPHFQRVIELRPDYPGALFSLGFAHRLLGQINEAEAYYERAIQTDESDPRVYSELAAIYMNRGEMDRAQALLERGADSNPESAELRALLASVLLERGDRKNAQRQLDVAEQLNPTAEIVSTVRQFVHGARKKS